MKAERRYRGAAAPRRLEVIIVLRITDSRDRTRKIRVKETLAQQGYHPIKKRSGKSQIVDALTPPSSPKETSRWISTLLRNCSEEHTSIKASAARR
jgi:hypothetical protein